MAKRKAAKTPKRTAATAKPEREPRVIALAERLGTLLGRARKKADGWLKKGTARPKSAAKKTKRSAAVPKAAPARRLPKPPPEELFDPRLGEPMGKQMGQKSVGKGRGARS